MHARGENRGGQGMGGGGLCVDVLNVCAKTTRVAHFAQNGILPRFGADIRR